MSVCAFICGCVCVCVCVSSCKRLPPLASSTSSNSVVLPYLATPHNVVQVPGSAHSAPVVLTVHLYMGTPNDTLCAKVCTVQFSDCLQFICIDIGSKW